MLAFHATDSNLLTIQVLEHGSKILSLLSGRFDSFLIINASIPKGKLCVAHTRVC